MVEPLKLTSTEKDVWKYRLRLAYKALANERARMRKAPFQKLAGGKPSRDDVRAGVDVACHRRFKASAAADSAAPQTLKSAPKSTLNEIARTVLQERVALWETANMPADYIVAAAPTNQAAPDQPPAEQPAVAQTDSPEIFVPATQDNAVLFVPETPQQSTWTQGSLDETVADTPGADDAPDARIASPTAQVSRPSIHGHTVHPASRRGWLWTHWPPWL